MFTRIQARRYRCLMYIDQSLRPFHALVGPNASGKSTFLDVIGFLSDLVRSRGDVLTTTQSRSPTFSNLLWNGEGDAFQFAVEAAIPDAIRSQMERETYTHVRYELEVGLVPGDGAIGITNETLWLTEPPANGKANGRDLFPAEYGDRGSILHSKGSGRKVSIKKNPGGNDNFYHEAKNTYNPSFRLGPAKSALANLPADVEGFPASTWFRDMLENGVQTLTLNSLTIRKPSPPGLGRRYQPDGSNLPWVIEGLRQDDVNYQRWLEHLRTALPDITGISTIERPEDKHRYIMVEYADKTRVPSWLVSDGTLRLLALTLPAYVKDAEGVFLIEEPENGVHPRAMEAILQSLESMYGSQVLIATHSPVALNMLKPEDVLCFAKTQSGATDIVRGDAHPALRDWKRGEPDFGTLFAAGILS